MVDATEPISHIDQTDAQSAQLAQKSVSPSESNGCSETTNTISDAIPVAARGGSLVHCAELPNDAMSKPSDACRKMVGSRYGKVLKQAVSKHLKELHKNPEAENHSPVDSSNSYDASALGHSSQEDVSKILLEMAVRDKAENEHSDRDAMEENSLKPSPVIPAPSASASAMTKVDFDDFAATYNNINSLVNAESTALGNASENGVVSSHSDCSPLMSQAGSNTSSAVKKQKTRSMAEQYRNINKLVDLDMHDDSTEEKTADCDASEHLKTNNGTSPLPQAESDTLVARVPASLSHDEANVKDNSTLISQASKLTEVRLRVVVGQTEEVAKGVSPRSRRSGRTRSKPSKYDDNFAIDNTVVLKRENSKENSPRRRTGRARSKGTSPCSLQSLRKEPCPQDSFGRAQSDRTTPQPRSLRARSGSVIYDDRVFVVDNVAFDKKEESEILEVRHPKWIYTKGGTDQIEQASDMSRMSSLRGKSDAKGKQANVSNKAVAADPRTNGTWKHKNKSSISRTKQDIKKAEANSNVLHDDREETERNHLRNDAASDDAKNTLPSRASARNEAKINTDRTANVTSDDRKRRPETQAVISESEGEMQNVTKKRAFENPDEHEVKGDRHKMNDTLRNIFESDFKQQARQILRKDLQRLVDAVWRRAPEHIKKSLPTAENEDLRKWKEKHFGERTPRPVFVPGIPELLIDMLVEDIRRKAQFSQIDLYRKARQTWASIPSDAKDCLPRENVPEYLSELQKWKALHVPDAAQVVLTKTSQRKRGRPSNTGDCDYEHSPKVSKGGRSSLDAAAQELQTRSKPAVRCAMDGGMIADMNTLDTVSSATQGEGMTIGTHVHDDLPSGAQEVGTSLHPTALSPTSFVQKDDPNKFYVEEEAHLYHNPPLPSFHSNGVSPQDLKCIPSPPPFDDLPKTGNCEWTWDNNQRVLLANFSSSVSSSNSFFMDPKDEAFFLEMMERNDVTVISEGLISVQSLNPDYWKPDYLRRILGQEYYHKFRRFDTVKTKEGFEKCFEVDGMVSMKVGDYIRYLEKRHDYLRGEMDGSDHSFSFVNHKGESKTLENVGIAALYMIDVDTNRLLPKLNSNFLESFRYHGVLPGGSHCMMNSVTSTARPFMGPNMYVTPPAAFTHFHQDGHGTVDSGHLCISGYNEVVLLRRLTERHKKHALMILTGDFGGENKRKGQKSRSAYFDGLYQEPHGDLLGEKPCWPTEAQIQRCRDMGYCPTVCIIKPGQLIHINKGRLHAFRKMSIATLPENDCHKKLREKTIKEHKLSTETLCMSIAWDWMYRGVSVGGINREISSVLEAVVLNRKNGRVSLAIPEFSLFQMAKMLNPGQATASRLGSFLLFDNEDSSVVATTPDAKTVSRGILPSLRHVIKQQLKTLGNASSSASQSGERGKRVTIAKRPNIQEDPMKFPLDPYGLDGFACKLCSRELSNVYYHCDGCEKLLSKDFNICLECHRDKKFACTVQMHPTNPKRHAGLNHTGTMKHDRVSRCPCKNGPVCGHCNFCLGCSCRCHTWFTLHSRMFGKAEGEVLLSGVVAACVSCESEESHKLGDLLADRLETAAKVH